MQRFIASRRTLISVGAPLSLLVAAFGTFTTRSFAADTISVCIGCRELCDTSGKCSHGRPPH